MAVNINNTRTGVGFFANGALQESLSLPTAELISYVTALIARLSPDARIVCASVVPAMTADFAVEVAGKGFVVEALVAQEGLGISFAGVNYAELGADLFANALAVHELWGRDSLNVDLGTGSTFCVVKSGVYQGTVIVPGMELSFRALTDRAALLSEVELAKPRRIINITTTACLQAGIYYGYTELVRGMISRIQREQGKLFVVLTGGIGSFLQDELMDVVDVFEPDLSLLGIQLAAKKVGRFPLV
ncbi:MAG TPA: type III pantothenate kinase [Bacillota bacterium]|nr:type III pantothenate kinase [Bacillota bacterium]